MVLAFHQGAAGSDGKTSVFLRHLSCVRRRVWNDGVWYGEVVTDAVIPASVPHETRGSAVHPPAETPILARPTVTAPGPYSPDEPPPDAGRTEVRVVSGRGTGGRWNWVGRYGLAVGAVAVATVMTWLIWRWIKPQVSPLYFVALLVAAWHGGLGPALVATALSGFISIYAFSDPVYSVRVDAEDFLRVAVFVVVSVAVSALANGRRRAEEALRAAHASLERRVSERTRELAEVNRALTHEVGEKEAAQRELIEHQARLQDLAAEVVLAEQRERRRIAERLHDELGQLLALSQIRVGGLHDVGDRAAL